MVITFNSKLWEKLDRSAYRVHFRFNDGLTPHVLHHLCILADSPEEAIAIVREANPSATVLCNAQAEVY